MKKNVHGNRYHAVASDGAVDWDHPLNRGRFVWWHGPAGVPAAGGRIPDLLARSPASFTGQTAAAPIWGGTTPRGSAAMTWNGSTQYAQWTTAPGLSQFTYLAWAKLVTSTPAFAAVFTIGNIDASLRVNSGGTAMRGLCGFSGGNATATDPVAIDSNWHRWGVSVSGTTVTLWRDGVSIATATGSGTALAGGGVLTLNSTSGAGSGGWQGQIDDFGGWNRPLSAVEVAADYRLSLAGYRMPDSPLRWASTRTWFVPTQTFNPAWAARSTTGVFGGAY